MSKSRERIAGVNPEEIGSPTGAYRVELLDRHTGKVTERIDKANYISPALARHTAWAQGALFHNALRFVHDGKAGHNWPYVGNGEFTGSELSLWNYAHPPMFPVEHIIGTDSSVPEVTTDDWGRGAVIGYGSRWKVGIPSSGPRGQINETQCALTEDSVKLVFDFNENQGNGTIESLMIGRVHHGWQDADVGPALVLPIGQTAPIGDGGTTTGYHPYYETGIGTSYYFGGMDDSGIYFYDYNSKKIYDYKATADTTDAFGRTMKTGAPTEITLASGPAATSSTSSGNYYNVDTNPAICRDGTNYVMAWLDGKGNVNLGSWTSTGTLNWANTSPLISSGYATENDSTKVAGLTKVGTKYYVMIQSNNPATYFPSDTAVNGKIYRVDATTHLVDANFSLGTDSAGKTIMAAWGSSENFASYGDDVSCCLATDGTDLFVGSTVGILRVKTDGTILDHLGKPYYLTESETGVAPWSTTANVQGIQPYDGTKVRSSRYFLDYPNTTNSDRYIGSLDSVSYPLHLNGLPGSGVFYRASKLWVNYGSGWAATQGVYFQPCGSGNIFSRTLLDTAVVKTASSTMKWTYELTLPSEWRDHGTTVIPAAPA